MIFFHVIQNTAPGQVQFVETTLSGYCLFTKFESRAKYFTKEEADELVKHLQERKPKNHYAKLPTTTNDDPIIRFTPPGNEVSDHRSDPEGKKDLHGTPEG